MVDWRQLADKWFELGEDIKNRIIAAMKQKYLEDPKKFIDWLREDAGRQTIWHNFVKMEPRFKVGEYVNVGPVYPPSRPGMAGLHESIVKVTSVRPQEPESLIRYAYVVQDSQGSVMTYLESDLKPAAEEEKPQEKPQPVGEHRLKVGDKAIDINTGNEYTVAKVDKWPSVLLSDKYNLQIARDESQLMTPEDYKAMQAAKAPKAAARRVPIPGAPLEGLSGDDIKRLHDIYNDALFRALGKVPTSSSSTFRVEVEKLKDKTFEEAKEAILGVAEEIIGSLAAAKVIRGAVAPPARARERRPTAERKPEVEAGLGIRVPPAQFPSYPLSYNMPFPRGPTSEEKIKLWQVFLYQMQQQGYDGTAYQRAFDDYIGRTQFLSWDKLRNKFNFFVKTIMSGLDLPPLEQWKGVPLPTGLKGLIQEKPELERIEDLITHYSSVVIRNKRSVGDIPTLEDLREELAEHGIVPMDLPLDELRDAAKTALTRAVERKDAWVAGISATEINDFLASA